MSKADLEKKDGNSLSTSGRVVILVVAFLGWGFAGVQMAITSQAMRDAAIDLMDRQGELDLEQYMAFNKVLSRKEELPESDALLLGGWKTTVEVWYSWYVGAFLFGAAAGGLVFGWLGDVLGRSKAMAASIFCYSILSGLTYFVTDPWHLFVVRFLTCMGIGGMWPTGVSLVSEAWSNLSRPMVAGIIGTAANVGIFLTAKLCVAIDITPEAWRWLMLVGAAPVLLGMLSLKMVPESPSWLRSKSDKPDEKQDEKPKAAAAEVFRPEFIRVTLIGIVLATVPLLGGWGSANFMVPWAAKEGEKLDPPDYKLKARVSQARALTGMVGSFVGGYVASIVGRRLSYMIVCIGALGAAQYAFWFLTPTDPSFMFWVSMLGLFSGVFFGWLPLFLPELFPTRIRSTGAGVSFNFGRILTASTLFATGFLLNKFNGSYAAVGRLTSLIYIVGMVAIMLAPDTSDRDIDE